MALTAGVSEVRIMPQTRVGKRVARADREKGDDEIVDREGHGDQGGADNRWSDHRQDDRREGFERRCPEVASTLHHRPVERRHPGIDDQDHERQREQKVADDHREPAEWQADEGVEAEQGNGEHQGWQHER